MNNNYRRFVSLVLGVVSATAAATLLAIEPPATTASVPTPAPAATPALQTAPPITGSVSLFAGQVKVMPVRSVSKIAVGNPRLLSTTVLPDRQLLMMAEATGDTTIHLWFQDGTQEQITVHITEADVDRVQKEVTELVSSLPYLAVRQVGGYIFIEGVAEPADKTRIAAITKIFPRVVDLTAQSELTMKKMVHLFVRVLEFKKTALESIGVDWSTNQPWMGPAFGIRIGRLPAASGNSSGSGIFTTNPIVPTRNYAALATELASRINLLIKDGDVSVLSSPRLSTRSGGAASFLAGGQIPLPATSALGQTNVTFKDYGIKLDFKPVVDGANNILLSIETEVSTVDNSTAVAGIPGFLTRRTKAEVNVHDSEPMIISGLVDSSVSSNVNKVPVLGDLPVFGPLFRSERRENNRTELVILIIPRVLESGKATLGDDQDQSDILDRNRDRLRERVRPDVDEAYR
ncbi:MAG TPA: pilus assembly protein N-terminal domain-containing protein [Burkholderiales bacterium]|nr:pilus assembly protein N-terminal domain-containing protein [Burkholderiales bacterium]